MLAECGELLRECASHHQIDECFRYGGEELCLLLPGVNAEAAAVIADGYRSCVEQREMSYEGQPLRVTISIGVATFPTAGDARITLAADRALYDAKRAGRNRVSLYRDSVIVAHASG